MPNPWEIYDALTDAIPEEVTLTTVNVGAQWTRVINSAGGIGMAWTMNVKTRPDIFPGVTLDGIPLREAAGLIRSWNLAESSIGQAAINSWHSRPETAEANGFVPTGQGINWGMVFDPYATDVAGKKVAVVGHFPFAQKALEASAWNATRSPATTPIPPVNTSYPNATTCSFPVPPSSTRPRRA